MENNFEKNQKFSLVYDVPVLLVVRLAETEMVLEDILNLNVGSVIELDKSVGEPVELYVGDVRVAFGEIIIVEDCYGIKITKVEDKADLVSKII